MSADWSGLFGAPVAGGLYALGSAAAWALGSILFRQLGDAASPLGLNLGKGLVGLLYLGVAVLLFGHTQLDNTSLTYLALSGLIGIAVGDTLFFMALVRLDPRITVLLATVGQVFTVVLGMAWLGERHAAAVWPGILLILGGVAWVLMERSDDEQRDSAQRREGVIYGLLSALCMSVGLILAKLGVSSRTEAAGLAIRQGLVPLQPTSGSTGPSDPDDVASVT
ncbi:MAG: EamA family transporter [Myxococcota bacterium]|nr:EamA family transporter [Myxococcota bacterium]